MRWLSKFFNFSRPKQELYIVVYDIKQLTLSTPNFRKVQEAFAQQKGFKTLTEHVRSILCLPGDKLTVITSVEVFRKVAEGNVERHFIFVVGHDLMFQRHLGRDFFVNKPESIATRFRSDAVPHIEAMLEALLPGHVLMRA